MEQSNDIPKVDDSEMRMPEQPMPKQTKHTVLNGIIIFLLVAILIALGFGLYIWGINMQPEITLDESTRPTAAENNEPESTTAEAQTDTTQVVSTSDEIDAIEADIDTTLLSDFDTEFAAIEAEISASGN